MVTDAGELAVAYDSLCADMQFITKLALPGKALIATPWDSALGQLQASILVAADPNTLFIVTPSSNGTTHFKDNWTVKTITFPSLQNIRDFDYISPAMPNQYLYMVNNLIGSLVAVPQEFIAARISVVGSFIVVTTDAALFELAMSGGAVITRPIQIENYEGQIGWVESTFSTCPICELASQSSMCLSYYSANDFTLTGLNFLGLMKAVQLSASAVESYGYNTATGNADTQAYPLPQYANSPNPLWIFFTWDINNVVSLGIEVNPNSAGTYQILVQCNNCGTDVKMLVEDDPPGVGGDSYNVATSATSWSSSIKWNSVSGQTDGAVIGRVPTKTQNFYSITLKYPYQYIFFRSD